MRLSEPKEFKWTQRIPLCEIQRTEKECNQPAGGKTMCCDTDLCCEHYEAWRDFFAPYCKCDSLEESREKFAIKWKQMQESFHLTTARTLMNPEIKIKPLLPTHINSW